MGRMTFTCPVCSASFLEEAMLAEHTREVHTNVPFFDCSFCVRRYASIDALNQHVRREHSAASDTDLPCPECGVLLPSAADLEEHLARQHPAFPGMTRGT